MGAAIFPGFVLLVCLVMGENRYNSPKKTLFGRLADISTNIVMFVNSQRKIDAKTRKAFIPSTTTKALIEVAHLTAERRLAVDYLAEISVRLTGDKLAINIEDSKFSRLSENDFTVASLTHDRILTNIAPSRHLKWHRQAYITTPAGAVLLCQPVSAVISARLALLPDPELLVDAAQVIGTVGCVPPEDEAIQRALSEHRAILIKGYGLLVWGRDPFDVLALAEIIDYWCQVSLAKSNHK
jgi:ribulose-5-phosphate 4-epimerase/fuculose-1-phosphate aldolase